MANTEIDAEKNGCGNKHLKLFLMLTVAVLGAMVAMGTAFSSTQNGQLKEVRETHTTEIKEHDERIRAVEQSGAVIEERLGGIQRSLARIEETIKTGASP